MIIKMKKNNYKQYQNVEQSLIINKNLSPAQLGVLIRLLSLPGDWNFSIKQFAKLYRTSEYLLRKDLKQLELLGYVSIKKIRDKGKFLKTELMVSDSPIFLTDKKTISDQVDDRLFS